MHSSLRDLGMALRSRELSVVEHVTDALDRLDADPFNTVITLDADRALERAAALDAELAAGEWRGPLHGVALGVKDLIDVAGLPTRCGSLVFSDAPPAEVDAPVVARLVEAGAVVVAKLHTHEFAYGPTGDVAATGPARNPHDPALITGGSSSGSAAAVAAGHLPLALGTDTGASIRTPAALCGVVGLKPAAGHLSTEGAFPLSETLDHMGLITADVHSASVAWDVLARPDGTGGGIQLPGVKGVRVGVPVDAYWQPADPSIPRLVLVRVPTSRELRNQRNADGTRRPATTRSRPQDHTDEQEHRGRDQQHRRNRTHRLVVLGALPAGKPVDERFTERLTTQRAER